MSTKMTAFTPEKNGFKFSNTFKTDIFWGPLHITTDGRCGGMSYASLDCFHCNTPMPEDSSLPPEGSVLNTYIYERLMKSLEGTGDQWADYLFNPFGTRTGELFNRGLKGRGEYLKMVGEIDAGRPVNLCLVAPSAEPGKSHQVVAFGYKVGDNLSDLEIYIYDCNYPKEACILYPDINAGFFRYKKKSNNQALTTWIAYFTDTDYVKRRPPNWNDDTATNYTRHNFSGQNVDQRDFRNDTLIGANFTNARIKRTDFSGADATAAIFLKAYGTTSDFIGCKLQNAMFLGADLRLCRFDEIKASMAVFSSAHLGGANFEKAMLTQAQFVNADLSGANLREADLTRAQLQQADLNGAVLEKTNLSQANLTNSKIGFVTNGAKAIFYRATLERADLRNSSFAEASFTKANLCYTILNAMRAPKANFTMAALVSADLRYADLRGAILKYANLSFADLRGAEFSGADFTDTVIVGADITGATGIPASVRQQVER